MQFITIIDAEKYDRDDAGQKIRLPNGQLKKLKVPSGTVFDGAEHIDLVVHGVAVPKDKDASELCVIRGIVVSKQIRGRQILETVDLVKEFKGDPPK